MRRSLGVIGGLIKMTTQEQLKEVLPSFPSDDTIHCIAEYLKSGEYHVIITRMEPIMLDVIFKLRHKYKTTFGQLFFPFEEGIRLADLISWTDKTKEVREHPMMITHIPKSIMTESIPSDSVCGCNACVADEGEVFQEKD
jgi:hypothetical protein